MSAEMQLLTKIIETRDLVSALSQKITPNMFKSSRAKAVFKFILEHFKNPAHPREVPSLDLVQERFPWFKPNPSPDSVAALAEQVRRNSLRIDLARVVNDTLDIAESEPEVAVGFLGRKLSSLYHSYIITYDIDLSQAEHVVMDLYYQAKSSAGMVGLPFPWPTLNEKFLGLRPGHLIILYGPPASMKTWLLLATAAHLYSIGKRVLIVTSEISRFEMLAKLASCLCGIEWSGIERGALQPRLEELLRETLRSISESSNGTGRNIIITETNSAIGGGTTAIRAKLEEVRPDILLVDGIYRLGEGSGSTRMDWKAVAVLSQDLKEIAKTYNIPVLGTAGANREAGVAHSHDIVKEADLLFYVTKTVIDGQQIVTLETKKARHGQDDSVSIQIRAIPGAVFEEVKIEKHVEEEPEDVREEIRRTFRKFK